MVARKRELPPEIDNSELLLRAVSTPSCLDADNRAKHLAFRLYDNQEDVSLCRLLYCGLIDFLIKAIRFPFRYISPKDVFAGAVEFRAGAVRELDEHIVLKATPRFNNPSHASIFYMKHDGSFFVGVPSTDPVDSSILVYEMALASIVSKVYNIKGEVIWKAQSEP